MQWIPSFPEPRIPHEASHASEDACRAPQACEPRFSTKHVAYKWDTHVASTEPQGSTTSVIHMLRSIWPQPSLWAPLRLLGSSEPPRVALHGHEGTRGLDEPAGSTRARRSLCMASEPQGSSSSISQISDLNSRATFLSRLWRSTMRVFSTWADACVL